MLLAWNYFIFVNPIELKCFPRWVILHGLQCIILALVENGRNVFFTGYCLLDVLQPLCCWKIFETPCAKRTAQPRGLYVGGFFGQPQKYLYKILRKKTALRWAMHEESDKGSEILIQCKLSKGSNR